MCIVKKSEAIWWLSEQNQRASSKPAVTSCCRARKNTHTLASKLYLNIIFFESRVGSLYSCSWFNWSVDVCPKKEWQCYFLVCHFFFFFTCDNFINFWVIMPKKMDEVFGLKEVKEQRVPLFKALVAEFLGLLLLVFFGCGCANGVAAGE